MSKLSAWFGGTFDPVHSGHLSCANELATLLDLDSITLMPNNVPPHRPQPTATAEQRLTMLRLATADQPLFTVDNREIQRDTPSWTIDTLTGLRDGLGPEQPLAFIIGQDSLLTINHWARWQELLEYCHLVVAQRPGYATHHADGKVQAWINRHHCPEPHRLHDLPSGKIYLANTSLYCISATDIRRRLRLGLDCQGLLAPQVIDYIRETGLYRDR